jgi:hypothetical protein
MNPPVDIGDVSPLVQFIVNNPGLADTLLARHVDDGSGHCRACALGSAWLPHVPLRHPAHG